MLSENYKEEQRLEFTGDRGLLAKLRTHVLLVNTRRYEFQTLTQSLGERCTTWWEKKTAMATLCKLDTVSKQDILTLELVKGVYDTNLKKVLLNKIDSTNLIGLVRIACTWSNAKDLFMDIDAQISAKQPTHQEVVETTETLHQGGRGGQAPYHN